MNENINIKNILPDEEQPRKYFDANKMYTLKQSIKKHGIKVPLVVEDIGKGKYLLIDGERRFRSAIELGLKEVPCLVQAPQSQAERLVQQFTIQEQHESWTPIEKAMSLLTLSKTLGMSLQDTCKKLDITTKDATRYTAFAELADKESYVKNEVPLDYAQPLKFLKNQVRRISLDVLKTEFDRSDEKTFEHQITKLIVKGTMTKRNDLTKLGDAFKKEPKLIEKFMHNDKVTPVSLFLEAKAQGAHALRNAAYNARYLVGHGQTFLKTHDVKVSDEQLATFKDAKKVLTDIINLVE